MALIFSCRIDKIYILLYIHGLRNYRVTVSVQQECYRKTPQSCFPSLLPSVKLTGKLRRPWNLVRLAISSGLTVLVVDADENTGIVGRVGAWEAHGLAASARA